MQDRAQDMQSIPGTIMYRRQAQLPEASYVALRQSKNTQIKGKTQAVQPLHHTVDAMCCPGSNDQSQTDANSVVAYLLSKTAQYSETASLNPKPKP